MSYYLQKRIGAKRNDKIHNVEFFAIMKKFYYYNLKYSWYTVKMVFDFNNLIQRQRQLIPNISTWDFRLIYCNKALNFLSYFSHWLDYKWNAELKNLKIDDTLGYQNILFPSYVEIIALMISPREEKTWQIMLFGIFHASSSSQKRYKRKAVSNKSSYIGLFRYLLMWY